MFLLSISYRSKLYKMLQHADARDVASRSKAVVGKLQVNSLSACFTMIQQCFYLSICTHNLLILQIAVLCYFFAKAGRIQMLPVTEEGTERTERTAISKNKHP